MLCHLGISWYLEGSCATHLPTKCSWKTAVKPSGGRLLALGLSPSSRVLLLIQRIQGALFTDAEALAAVMATRKEDKACQDGLVCVTQRSVYPHFCTHLHASSHTHWHRYTCSHQHPEAYAERLCKAYKCHMITFPLIFRVHNFRRLGYPRGNLVNIRLWSFFLGRRDLG